APEGGLDALALRGSACAWASPDSRPACKRSHRTETAPSPSPTGDRLRSSGTTVRSWILLPRQLPMRPVLECPPVAAPFDGHAALPGRFLHGVGDLVIERPVPAHFAIDPCAEIDRVAGQMAALHRPRRAGPDELLLPRRAAQPFQHGEVNRRQFDRALDHANKVRIDALQSF